MINLLQELLELQNAEADRKELTTAANRGIEDDVKLAKGEARGITADSNCKREHIVSLLGIHVSAKHS